MNDSNVPAFPDAIGIDSVAGGMAWDGQNFILANQDSPWGIIRITALENGQYRKTTIPVVDNVYQQQMHFQGITWNGEYFVAISDSKYSESETTKVFVALDPETFQVIHVLGSAPDSAYCLSWDGANYWAATRLDNENQQVPRGVLYKFDDKLELENQYNVAGHGCQGMAWDGKFLWLADVFASSLNLYDISRMPPAVRHQYKLSINNPAGITYDGSHIWLANQGQKQLMRLQEELYFDWLGERFDVSSASQIKYADRFGDYQSGTAQAEDLVKPLVNGEIAVDEIPAYLLRLSNQYNNDEIRQILILAREKISEQEIRRALLLEIEKLTASGQVEYINESPVNDESVSTQFFHAMVVNGDLLASWKIVAGTSIVSGIDAARPPQLPEDLDFETFIRYRITISGQKPDIEKEIDYDIFGSEDMQKDIVLIEDIKPGEYEIDIEAYAQYYSATEANHYRSNLLIKLSY